MRVEVVRLKEWSGRSVSSSSLCTGDGGLSGTVEPSEINESFDTWLVGKRACLAWLMGEDSGKLWVFFHEACLVVILVLRPVAAADDAAFGMLTLAVLILLLL